MRIFHIIDEFRLGGAQTHLVTILREMIRREEGEHRVISLFEGDGIDASLNAVGVEAETLACRADFGRKRVLAVMGQIRSAIRDFRPDVVEAHLTWSRLLALPAAALEGVPRRIGFEQGDVYLSSWKFRAANFLLQSFAQRVVCCSEALAAWAKRTHGLSPSRVMVLHNCVDPALFRPKWDLEVPSPWPVGVGTVFCAVGTLGYGVNKRVDVAIRAVAEARRCGADVGLVVCGDGDQRLDLERLAHEAGVADTVRFLGMRSDVPDVMASCDAFCHAAPFEPFGIVCVEAMAVGLPVVVPDSGGIREAVEEGETGLLYEPLNHEALAEKMMRLHEDQGLRERLGISGRNAAETRFSVSGYVDRLLALYGGRA
jgi:glycosyltransferase involved in cell wall biosynthesis